MKKTDKPAYKFLQVMLIEDNSIDVFIHKTLIHKRHFAGQIMVFDKAGEAIQFFRKEKNTLKVLPALIFLNLYMPMMDGFQFLEEFEKMLGSFVKRVKIIVVTSSINPADKKRAMSFKSVIHYVTKPLTLKDLDKIEGISNENKK